MAKQVNLECPECGIKFEPGVTVVPVETVDFVMRDSALISQFEMYAHKSCMGDD